VKRAAGLSLGEVAPIPPGSDSYLTAEARARVEIDRQLQAAGWAVQDAGKVNLAASQGVGVREFVLKPPHGWTNYALGEGTPSHPAKHSVLMPFSMKETAWPSSAR
jgi:hypothetical protein